MRNWIIIPVLLITDLVPFQSKEQVVDSTTYLFTMDTVAHKLAYPWEITYGPDDSLWITEARGYRVLRMNPKRTGADRTVPLQQVLKIPLGSSMVSFNRSVGTWPQGGMQGLAIHPEFLNGKPWVYLSYVYGGTCPSNASSPCIFRTKIVRCRFYFDTSIGNPSLRFPRQDTLIIMDTVISNLSGSNDHNSGRLKISPFKEGPDNTYKLYYTIGDMGAGQFNNSTRTNYAQNTDTAEGKVLRLNTEPDGDGIPASPVHEYDKWREWIPNDNPFKHSFFKTVYTPVFSYGHRNGQGLVWGSLNGGITWQLYQSEHGDKSDDEVNIIEKGGNYGWPKVAGLPDNNYSSLDSYPNNDSLASKPINYLESDWATTNKMINPIYTTFTGNASSLPPLWAQQIFTWPTIAPSSIDFYEGNIPGWKYSLLVTSLKYGMYRLKLNTTGLTIDSNCTSNLIDTLPLLHSWRIRDVAIDPDPNSGILWVVTDSSGSTSGPTGGFSGANINTKNGGVVLKLTYKNLIILPVKFISFSGSLVSQDQVRLDWKINVDKDHKAFEIERSGDNSNFSVIGTLNTLPPYSYTDKEPLQGNNYYRIREIGKSGSIIYSHIILVQMLNNIAFTIFPNPAGNFIYLRINSKWNENLEIEINDIQGMKILTRQWKVNAGTNEINMNVQQLISQVYILKLTDQKGEVLATQKILKL